MFDLNKVSLFYLGNLKHLAKKKKKIQFVSFSQGRDYPLPSIIYIFFALFFKVIVLVKSDYT